MSGLQQPLQWLAETHECHLTGPANEAWRQAEQDDRTSLCSSLTSIAWQPDLKETAQHSTKPTYMSLHFSLSWVLTQWKLISVLLGSGFVSKLGTTSNISGVNDQSWPVFFTKRYSMGIKSITACAHRAWAHTIPVHKKHEPVMTECVRNIVLGNMRRRLTRKRRNGIGTTWEGIINDRIKFFLSDVIK